MSSLRVLTALAVLVVAPSLPAQTLVDFGRHHALVIGIDDYQHLPKLQSAVADARAVARLLQTKYGFTVRLLLDATRSQIITALNTLRRELTEKDNLLVYYAGHGVLDGQTGFWMAADAMPNLETNWIPVSTLSRNFKQMTARHVLVVSDSCYSGTLVRSVRGSLRSGHEQTEWIKRMNEKRSRTALTSGGLEPVLDSGGGTHSVFAKAFLGVLGENEGVLDGQTLFDRIKDPVVVNASQTPTYADIRNAGHEFGDFLFVPDGVTVELASAPESAPALGLRDGARSRDVQDTLFWESIKDSDDPDVYRAYLEAFPGGTFSSLARIRLAKLSEARSAVSPGVVASVPPSPPSPPSTDTRAVPPAAAEVAEPPFEVDPVRERRVTATASNARAAPSVEATKLATLAEGTVVQVTGTVRGRSWSRVALPGGREAYVHESLLAALEPSRAPALAPAPVADPESGPTSAPAPTPAPARPAGVPLRIGLFPFESVVPCFVPVGKELRDAVAEQLATRPDAKLAFSVFRPRAERGEIPFAHALWDQNMAHRQPVSDAVRRSGGALDLDAVIMAWYYCSQSSRKDPGTYKVEVHLIDVATGARYRSTASLFETHRAVAKTFSEYFESRPDSAVVGTR